MGFPSFCKQNMVTLPTVSPFHDSLEFSCLIRPHLRHVFQRSSFVEACRHSLQNKQWLSQQNPSIPLWRRFLPAGPLLLMEPLLCSMTFPWKDGDEGYALFSSTTWVHLTSQVQEAPTVLSAVRSWIEMLNPTSYLKKEQPWRILLHSFSGTVMGGEMLLVIGKPGSGCTTFLKTLANMRSEYKDTHGELLYSNQKASWSPARRTFCGTLTRVSFCPC